VGAVLDGEMVASLLEGTAVTLKITFLAAILAMAVALVMGTARLSGSALVRLLAGLYIEVFRGTSALVQLYVIYFVLPFFGLSPSPLAAGVLALGLNTGSYGAEIVRGAVQAVPAAQREAAIALGLGRWARFRRVILPQALLVILPSAGTLLIDLVKLTSLVSLITLADLTFEAQQIRLESGRSLEVFALVLVIYFLLSTVVATAINWCERRARRGYDIGLARSRT
jgi:polar amino acid transport system permease protein